MLDRGQNNQKLTSQMMRLYYNCRYVQLCQARLIALLIGTLVIGGCASRQVNDAPESYLSPSVGLSHLSVSAFSDFSSYAKAVEEQLQQHRVPFNAAQAQLEIERAKPEQFNPISDCPASTSRGIVILVHGLSDTAFLMKEIAGVVASNCYIARTILLPGHGTRPGDLLRTDLSHWRTTVRELVEQASMEHETVLLGGFSLGAVLSLSQALESNSGIDGLIAFSPAYTLSSYNLARFAPYLGFAKRWIDRELPDDYLRYEAMPTRGVAQTVNAMKLMHRQLARAKSVDIPWLLVQSMDDAVIVPKANIELFRKYATHPNSRVINLYTSQSIDDESRTIWLPGASKKMRVLGVTHTGVTFSAKNKHYGINGDYRNCGGTAPRAKNRVKQCMDAEQVWYGLWNKPSPAHLPTARSSFNPQFEAVAGHISEFLQQDWH